MGGYMRKVPGGVKDNLKKRTKGRVRSGIKGQVKATRDVAGAFYRGATKAKRKGFKECPTCKKNISARANACPHCGHAF